MIIQFDPSNNIIKLCLQGLQLEGKDNFQEANIIFTKALNESKDDFEKYLSTYYLAKNRQDIKEKLNWFHLTLDLALSIEDIAVKSALPILYKNIAHCYEQLSDNINTKKFQELSKIDENLLIDNGPFYHGTKAELEIGNLLVPGGVSNYQDTLVMNHIYFTALVNGAGLAAGLAKGDGSEHVYIVKPTGVFENDPNVTNQKFPGNPTRSYRSNSPLKIIGEITDWRKQTQSELDEWNKKIDSSIGKIIN